MPDNERYLMLPGVLTTARVWSGAEVCAGGGWWVDRMGPCGGSREGIRVGSNVGEPRNSGVSLSNSSLVNIREDCG